MESALHRYNSALRSIRTSNALSRNSKLYGVDKLDFVNAGGTALHMAEFGDDSRLTASSE